MNDVDRRRLHSLTQGHHHNVSLGAVSILSEFSDIIVQEDVGVGDAFSRACEMAGADGLDPTPLASRMDALQVIREICEMADIPMSDIDIASQ